MKTRLKQKFFSACAIDAEEIVEVGNAAGFVVALFVDSDAEDVVVGHIFVDVGNEVGPLDGSPTKNISPPIGRLRPAEFWN